VVPAESLEDHPQHDADTAFHLLVICFLNTLQRNLDDSLKAAKPVDPVFLAESFEDAHTALHLLLKQLATPLPGQA
jgi:hypothetical protein